MEQGEIFPQGQKQKRVAYAALTREKKIERHLSQNVDLKTAGDFHVVGKPVVRKTATKR